jgi:hypothetical protein
MRIGQVQNGLCVIWGLSLGRQNSQVSAENLVGSFSAATIATVVKGPSYAITMSTENRSSRAPDIDRPSDPGLLWCYRFQSADGRDANLRDIGAQSRTSPALSEEISAVSSTPLSISYEAPRSLDYTADRQAEESHGPSSSLALGRSMFSGAATP